MARWAICSATLSGPEIVSAHLTMPRRAAGKSAPGSDHRCTSARSSSPSNRAVDRLPGAVSPVTSQRELRNVRGLPSARRGRGRGRCAPARSARPYRRMQHLEAGESPVSSRHTRWATSQVLACRQIDAHEDIVCGRDVRPIVSRLTLRTMLCGDLTESMQAARVGARRARHVGTYRWATASGVLQSRFQLCDPGSAAISIRPRCVGAAHACRAVHVAGRERSPRSHRVDDQAAVYQ